MSKIIKKLVLTVLIGASLFSGGARKLLVLAANAAEHDSVGDKGGSGATCG